MPAAMGTALLFTIDVEEFTLPAEYGIPFDEEAAYALGRDGLRRAADVLARRRVPATLFVTWLFARRFRDELLRLQDAGHEIGLHAFDHRHDYLAMPPEESRRWLGEARDGLRSTLGARVAGYRANRFRAPQRSVLRDLGFSWTSNLHPAWVPGAYDHRDRPREIHEDEGLLEVPVSATPGFRLPVSWFWMRNFGLAWTKLACSRAHLGTGYLHVYVHPWEYADLPALKGLPLKGRLSVRRTGGRFATFLDRFLDWTTARGLEPRTISDHLRHLGRMPDA